MRVNVKKDVNLEKGALIHKNTEAVVIAVSWTENHNEKYIIQIDDVLYSVDKKDADIYG